MRLMTVLNLMDLKGKADYGVAPETRARRPGRCDNHYGLLANGPLRIALEFPVAATFLEFLNAPVGVPEILQHFSISFVLVHPEVHEV